MNTKGLLAVLVFLCLFSVNDLYAQFQRDALRGLKEISVIIEDLGGDARSGGLREAQLRTDVELSLRRNGITVSEAATPFLYLVIAVVETGSGGYAAAIVVNLQEPVTLQREPFQSTTARTWERGKALISPKGSFASDVREVVAEYVDGN